MLCLFPCRQTLAFVRTTAVSPLGDGERILWVTKGGEAIVQSETSGTAAKDARDLRLPKAPGTPGDRDLHMAQVQTKTTSPAVLSSNEGIRNGCATENRQVGGQWRLSMKRNMVQFICVGLSVFLFVNALGPQVFYRLWHACTR